MQSKMGGGCSLLLGNGNRSRDKNACACTWHSAAHVVKECERENSPMGCINFVSGEWAALTDVDGIPPKSNGYISKFFEALCLPGRFGG